MVNYKILFGIMAILFSGCGKDDELLLKRVDYTGNELRIDGYYYSEFASSEPSYRIYFIYRNGIIFSGSSPNISDIEKIEIEFKNGEFYDKVKENKDHWGVFQIGSGEIDFERWYPSSKPYKTFLRSGKILNDTTFHITSFSDSDGSNKEVRDEIYHFKKFSPKPDSTNSFVP